MKFIQKSFGILILLTISNCAATTNYNNRQTNRKQQKLIEGSVDLEADPCDDFYKFACGKWEAGSKYHDPLTMLDYNVNMELSHGFNSFRMHNKPKFIKQAYNYYKSCKSLKMYESIKYLMWLKTNDGFKWHTIRTRAIKDNTQYDWVKTLAKMRTYGFNDVFIQQIVMSKINDVKTFIIDLDKPRTYGGFQPMTEENLEIVILTLPAQLTFEKFNYLWKEIEQFEQKLQELDTIEDIPVDTESDYENERLFSFENLPLQWLKDYLKIVLNQTEVNAHMELYIQNIPYMKALDGLLKQYSQRFLCKYLEVRFLWYLYTIGPADFIDEDCLASTRGIMPTAMHWQYEQHHPELQKEYAAVYKIFSDIRRHFNNTVIKNEHGFNATIIQYLQYKINHMKLRLNNIPRIDAVETLEKFYEHLNLDAKKFYANHLKLLRFNFLAQRYLLSNQAPILDATYLVDLDMGSSSSSYFLMNYNTVSVPLTFLQHPIYSPGMDDIYKYSSLGFLLAHEMFHGFSGRGLLTAANGRLTSIQFEENPLFNTSFNCLLEINPNVIGEKIPDISGLRYAYQTFFDLNPEATAKKYYLHGNEISARKLFFLNFAQSFCGQSADETEEFILMSEHGSGRKRVMDTVAHFREFSKEFNCNSSHRLHPQKTCNLWR